MEYKRKITDISFAFAVKTVKFCLSVQGNGDIANVLLKQLVRSATSIGANIEEAQAGQSKRDFIHKTAIACKEARESLYWLRILKETGFTYDKKVDELIKDADEIVSILIIIIRNAKKKV